ncbi:MAG: ATP synthase delta/epsilon chain alpha-helix domain-containing protein, partial [Phycisphaerales bacterium]|nr:ATP synthase delta/epsilon chain alpha-helix domain-containing protein [Phycisphaerales bacterium]
GKDIDKARADEARRAAEENINKHADDINFAMAEMDLAKAMEPARWPARWQGTNHVDLATARI